MSGTYMLVIKFKYILNFIHVFSDARENYFKLLFIHGFFASIITLQSKGRENRKELVKSHIHAPVS